MQIGIVGNGVVGNATGASLVSHVGEVRTYDVMPERSSRSLQEVLDCDLIFVCLPTPQKRGSLECDTETVAQFFIQHATVNRQANYVLRSTVPIGFTRHIADVCQLPNLVHSPEFLTARTAVEDAKNPTRILIGWSEPVRDLCQEAYVANHPITTLYTKRWPNVSLFHMTYEESEVVKLFQNAHSAMKVSIFNEFKRLADHYDLDWQWCLDALLAGGWINPMHTQVPGQDGKYGFGGSCLPKDLASLAHQMTEADLSCYMTYAALRRNEEDRNR